jgi:prolipoprotein diacylglyceryltransferase
LCIEPSALSKLPPSVTPWQVQTFALISPPGFPLAVRFPPDAAAFEQHRHLGLLNPDATVSLPVHPVQLYEASLALMLCIWLHCCFPRRRWHGQIFCLFVSSYAMIRFATEFFRADNAPLYFGLTLSQVISVCIGLPATIALAWRAVPAFQKVGLEGAVPET